MASVNEILQSMLDEMKKYEKEYNETTEKINNIIKDYSAKIDELQQQRLALQDEGNKKIDLLNARKEQLSGKHSSLFEQYKKFAGKEPELSKDKTKSEHTEEPVKELKPIKKSNKKVEQKSEEKTTPNIDVKKDEGLSPDEIAKLTEIASESKLNEAEKPLVDNNGNEIPDYLQDSYVK